MDGFREIKPKDLEGNPFRMAGDDWFLLTAGSGNKWNTMTAGWATLGVLWGRNVLICFVRPSRHTFGFMEQAEQFSCSFFGPEHRGALDFCGSHSGRNTDKAEGAGITPVDAGGVTAFQEARLVIVCRKIYADDIRAEKFLDPSLAANYPKGDFHRWYAGEIEHIWHRPPALAADGKKR
ncbi:MAG: flavin reductase [Planctomycetota bacterium]